MQISSHSMPYFDVQHAGYVERISQLSDIAQLREQLSRHEANPGTFDIQALNLNYFFKVASCLGAQLTYSERATTQLRISAPRTVAHP
jgi:hypothetical protein